MKLDEGDAEGEENGIKERPLAFGDGIKGDFSRNCLRILPNSEFEGFFVAKFRKNKD